MTAYHRRILTVPNLLSLVRLCLIPVFIRLYDHGAYAETAAVLVLSGLTDVVDGWYARRFHAVSDVGKVLDPIADKLTQAATLLMLVSNHPTMLLPFLLLIVKEMFMGISGLLVIRRTGVVPAAVWHGKATTAGLYLLMFLHVIWKDIPAQLSNILTAACIVLMLLSLSLYAVDNIRRIRCAGSGGTHA